MLFDNGAKGLTLDRERLKLEVVEVVDGDWEAAGVIVHDETNKGVAQMLIDMPYPAFPIALGVIYCDPAPTFESAVVTQNLEAAKGKTADLNALLAKGQRSEEHTSELQSLMRISYAVLCLKKKNKNTSTANSTTQT